jgi:hypothetical protein
MFVAEQYAQCSAAVKAQKMRGVELSQMLNI